MPYPGGRGKASLTDGNTVADLLLAVDSAQADPTQVRIVLDLECVTCPQVCILLQGMEAKQSAPGAGHAFQPPQGIASPEARQVHLTPDMDHSAGKASRTHSQSSTQLQSQAVHCPYLKDMSEGPPPSPSTSFQACVQPQTLPAAQGTGW